MAYEAPAIGTLSAHDYGKIQRSLDAYLKTQGKFDATGDSYNDRVGRTRFELTKREAAKAREAFKSGSTYGIEDEYRYMVSQGFQPTAMQTAAAPVEERKKIPGGIDLRSYLGEGTAEAWGDKHFGVNALNRVLAQFPQMTIRQIEDIAGMQGLEFGRHARIKADQAYAETEAAASQPSYSDLADDILAKTDEKLADILGKIGDVETAIGTVDKESKDRDKITDLAVAERDRIADEARRTMASNQRSADQTPNLRIRGAGETPKTAGTQNFRRRINQFRINPFVGLGGIDDITKIGRSNKSINI